MKTDLHLLGNPLVPSHCNKCKPVYLLYIIGYMAQTLK